MSDFSKRIEDLPDGLHDLFLETGTILENALDHLYKIGDEVSLSAIITSLIGELSFALLYIKAEHREESISAIIPMIRENIRAITTSIPDQS